MAALQTGGGPRTRYGQIDACSLDPPAVLIFNPNAGRKLGVSTNTEDADAAAAALTAVGIPFEPRPTEHAGHARVLAEEAVREGRALVIAAGGDGTVGEVAQALAGTDTVLGVMPLGSVMNVARTLGLPREFDRAAEIIREGRVLAMDLGRVGTTYFLEAAGVGLGAGLLAYFDQLDTRGLRWRVVWAALRFVSNLGMPRLHVETEDGAFAVRAPMVTVANGPYVGAAYALAPDARIDDGLLDVVVFRRVSAARLLLHLALLAGGRRLPPPEGARHLRATRVRIVRQGRRPLPVHADGTAVGATPMEFTLAPAALRVLVGPPAADSAYCWEPPDAPPTTASVGALA